MYVVCSIYQVNTIKKDRLKSQCHTILDIWCKDLSNQIVSSQRYMYNGVVKFLE